MSVIPTHHIKVFVKRAFHLSHHQSCSPFHCWILGQPAPKFHRKAKVHIFGRRLLILSVTRLEKTFRPGMTMKYVKGSHARKIFVVLVRVGNLLFVRIYFGDDGLEWRVERRGGFNISDHCDYKRWIFRKPFSTIAEKVVQVHYDTGRVDVIPLDRNGQSIYSQEYR